MWYWKGDPPKVGETFEIGRNEYKVGLFNNGKYDICRYELGYLWTVLIIDPDTMKAEWIRDRKKGTLALLDAKCENRNARKRQITNRQWLSKMDNDSFSAWLAYVIEKSQGKKKKPSWHDIFVWLGEKEEDHGLFDRYELERRRKEDR